jgi:hypothetical protein
MHTSRKSRPPVPLGIKGESVVAGDHLALFYDTEEEFTNALGFIQTGLYGTDHCIVFGIPSDTERMLRVLGDAKWDVERLMREGRLSVLRPEATCEATDWTGRRHCKIPARMSTSRSNSRTSAPRSVAESLLRMQQTDRR